MGHPRDGLLEAWHWRGKRFESLEEVHPLVFASPGGGEVLVIHPACRSAGCGRTGSAGWRRWGASPPGWRHWFVHPRLRRPPAEHPPPGQGVGRDDVRRLADVKISCQKRGWIS